MSNDLADKINNLQKNFSELNSLFELNLLATQAATQDELLTQIDNFIKDELDIKDIVFFVKNENIYKPVPDREDVRDLTESKIPFLKDNRRDLISVKNEDGSLLYPDFFENYSLEFLNPEFVRVFYKEREPFGICIIGAKQSGRPYDEEEIALLVKSLMFIEPMLVKFIRQIEQEQLITTLHKSLHNLSILYNISQAVNFIDDLKGLIQVILGRALETIGAEKGSLMLYDITDNTLQVKVVYGLNDPKAEFDINNGVIECAKFKVNEGIAGKVFAEKRSIITHLGQNDPRFKKADTPNTENNGQISSMICVPLIAKGEAIGVINITNKKNNKLFNKQDLEFIEALSNQAAIAIDNARLYELATKDGLTKLYIHRHFRTLLEEEITRATRYKHVMSLLMTDIDDFKRINDTYGHLTGDKVLKEIARTMKNSIRNIDIASRYGGEEFTIILPETAAKDAVIIAERLRNNISKLEFTSPENVPFSVSISIGIAEFPSCASTPEELIECADKALYRAKNSGKNCVYVHTPNGFYKHCG